MGIDAPCFPAGLPVPGTLVDYRNDAVYMRSSRYVPPRWEAARDAMPALFDLLEHEPEPGVRAVLGHRLFGYLHSYPDGDGRMARFPMNAMLGSGGWASRKALLDSKVAGFGRPSLGKIYGGSS